MRSLTVASGVLIGFLSQGAAQTCDATTGKCSGDANTSIYWPKSMTFGWQLCHNVQVPLPTGSHCIVRAAMAPLERIFHDNKLRRVSRGEAPGFVFGYVDQLYDSLRNMALETRSSSCPGLLGLHDKKKLRQNLNTFNFMMGWGGVPSYLPTMWELPRQINELAPPSGWIVMRRADSHTANTMHILKAGETDRMRQIMQERDPNGGNKPLYNDWIALEYIMPNLWNLKKWDFRVHILVAGTDPVRLFVGGPSLGFARTAVDKFTMNSRDLTVHTALAYAPGTNNDRGDTDELRVRSLKDVIQNFERKEWDSIWAQIERASLEAVLSVEPRMRDSGHLLMMYSDQCFEYLGIDFMLDSNGKVYMLEINRNNDPGYYNAAQGQVKSQVVHDNLCVLGISCAYASKAPVPTIPDEERALLEPFEKSSNPLERLAEDQRRLEIRAARTEYAMVWPPPKRYHALARDLNQTEEWAPSHYTRSLFPTELKKQGLIRPRVMGVTNNRIVVSE